MARKTSKDIEKELTTIAGKKFGKWTAIEYSHSERHSTLNQIVRYIRCQCECGFTTRVNYSNLVNGRSTKCRSCARRKYTPTQLITVNIYRGMMSRCYNPNNPHYNMYGAKGITVCERWRHSVHNFLADMGERPSLQHYLTRLNVNGNYEPSNCVWQTRKESTLHRRYANLLLASKVAKRTNLSKERIRQLIASGTLNAFIRHEEKRIVFDPQVIDFLKNGGHITYPRHMLRRPDKYSPSALRKVQSA